LSSLLLFYQPCISLAHHVFSEGALMSKLQQDNLHQCWEKCWHTKLVQRLKVAAISLDYNPLVNNQSLGFLFSFIITYTELRLERGD
jgi:hypothetical protein